MRLLWPNGKECGARTGAAFVYGGGGRPEETATRLERLERCPAAGESLLDAWAVVALPGASAVQPIRLREAEPPDAAALGRAIDRALAGSKHDRLSLASPTFWSMPNAPGHYVARLSFRNRRTDNPTHGPLLLVGAQEAKILVAGCSRFSGAALRAGNDVILDFWELCCDCGAIYHELVRVSPSGDSARLQRDGRHSM